MIIHCIVDDVLKVLIMTHAEEESGLLSQKRQLLEGIVADGEDAEQAAARVLCACGLSNVVNPQLKVIKVSEDRWQQSTPRPHELEAGDMKQELVCGQPLLPHYNPRLLSHASVLTQMFFSRLGEGSPQHIAILTWLNPETAHGHFTTQPDVAAIGEFSHAKLHWGWFNALELRAMTAVNPTDEDSSGQKQAVAETTGSSLAQDQMHCVQLRDEVRVRSALGADVLGMHP